jgi:acyl-CoA thioester hydrolase
VTRFKDNRPPNARVFETRLPVQWADVDIAGVMYFAAYQRFAERAEMELFRELGYPYGSLFERYDMWLPRVRVESEYHHPALMDDWLSMKTWIQRVGASSIRWQTVVYNERTNEAGAVFHLTVACVDRKTFKSRPLPKDLRGALLACVPQSGAIPASSA